MMGNLTPQEINLAIAKLVYPNDTPIQAGRDYLSTQIKVISDKKRHTLAIVDYCNNWNDLMPLMIDHNVQYHINAASTQKYMAECLFKYLESNHDG